MPSAKDVMPPFRKSSVSIPPTDNVPVDEELRRQELKSHGAVTGAGETSVMRPASEGVHDEHDDRTPDRTGAEK